MSTMHIAAAPAGILLNVAVSSSFVSRQMNITKGFEVALNYPFNDVPTFSIFVSLWLDAHYPFLSTKGLDSTVEGGVLFRDDKKTSAGRGEQ